MATSKPRRLTLAFAGPGETTLENVKALLNDFIGVKKEDADGYPVIPDDDELDLRLVFPATPNHLTPGVETVLDWTDYADLAYDVVVGEERDRAVRRAVKSAENEIEATNVNLAVIKELQQAKEDGREALLILLWGPEDADPGPDAETLLDLATTYDIKALDLTAGLDDIGFGDEGAADEPEPEPEPEPEEEKPVRGSRRRSKPEPEDEPEEKPARGRRRSLDSEEKPLEDTPEEDEKPKTTRSRRKTAPEPEPEGDSVEEQVAKARHAAQPQTDEEITDGMIKGITVKQQAKSKTISPDVYNRYAFRPADQERLAKHEAVRSLVIDLMGALDALLPASHEKDVVFDKADEVMFWANAAVARHMGEASEQEDGQEAAEEPVRGRGRPRRDGSPAQPRSAADKAVMEYYDEEAGEWVKKGRGRPPRDAKTRMVDPKTGAVVED